MARVATPIPPFRLHKASGRGYVNLDGRRHYLGSFDDPTAHDAYTRLVAQWLATGRRLPQAAGDALTVVELCDAFMGYAEDYYRRPDGKRTSEPANFARVIRELRTLYGRTRAREFGPIALRTLRDRLVELGWCRREINKGAGRVRQVFKWGIGRQLIPAEVKTALECVEPLRRGRSVAPETEAVKPVPVDNVNAIKGHVSTQVWALIQLQLLTGARAGELVGLRAVDLDMTGRVWVFTPQSHKTAHHGHARTIYIGPKGQDVVRPFLTGRAVTAPMFSPLDAEAARLEALHAARETPLSCGNSPGTNRKRKPKVKPGETYTTESYRRAIARACKAANVPHWHPHQLRHTAATTLEREFGLETTALILGHASPAMTRLYAERNHGKAIEVIEKIG